MKSSALEIRQVAKSDRQKPRLKPFSLKAEQGQCIALCGGNGAGKTTLLHILAGILSPTEGTVMLDTIDMKKNRKAYLAQIGYMPDEFYAQELMTVTEFLNYYAALQGIQTERVNEVIISLGLEEKRDEQIKHLSKGMRQRLLFGQAWIRDPQVLLLDEPTNGLDPYWIDVFISILEKIKAGGTTIIFSTHMMDVAAEIADLVIFMEKGEMSASVVNPHQDTEQFMEELLQFYRKKEKDDGDVV